MSVVLPDEVEDAVATYLGRVDRGLPGRVEGFYVVGSTALGAFRAGRSDIDVVAVVADGLGREELERLHKIQRRLYGEGLARSLPVGRWPLVCNGVYVTWPDLDRSALDVVPLAAHVSGRFEIGKGFDVNPVTWRTLATKGIAVRGPDVADLTIPSDDAELRLWTRTNLDAYWQQWADRMRRRGWAALRANFRQLSDAWGALGAPRLHCTIATGEIVSKEGAGEYALDVFDERWHPLVRGALAYWRGEARGGPFSRAGRRRRDAADFVDMVVASAHEL
jgi:hypothetical protein